MTQVIVKDFRFQQFHNLFLPDLITLPESTLHNEHQDNLLVVSNRHALLILPSLPSSASTSFSTLAEKEYTEFICARTDILSSYLQDARPLADIVMSMQSDRRLKRFFLPVPFPKKLFLMEGVTGEYLGLLTSPDGQSGCCYAVSMTSLRDYAYSDVADAEVYTPTLLKLPIDKVKDVVPHGNDSLAVLTPTAPYILSCWSTQELDIDKNEDCSKLERIDISEAACIATNGSYLYIGCRLAPYLYSYDLTGKKLSVLPLKTLRPIQQIFALDSKHLLIIHALSNIESDKELDKVDGHMSIYSLEKKCHVAITDPCFANIDGGIVPRYWMSAGMPGGVNPKGMGWMVFLAAANVPDICVLGRRITSTNSYECCCSDELGLCCFDAWLPEKDDGCAAFPLTDEYQSLKLSNKIDDSEEDENDCIDTFCRGFALDYTNTVPIPHPSGDPQDAPLPPAPLLWSINTAGWLLCYQLVNLDLQNLCNLTKPVEKLENPGFPNVISNPIRAEPPLLLQETKDDVSGKKSLTVKKEAESAEESVNSKVSWEDDSEWQDALGDLGLSDLKQENVLIKESIGNQAILAENAVQNGEKISENAREMDAADNGKIVSENYLENRKEDVERKGLDNETQLDDDETPNIHLKSVKDELQDDPILLDLKRDSPFYPLLSSFSHEVKALDTMYQKYIETLRDFSDQSKASALATALEDIDEDYFRQPRQKLDSLMDLHMTVQELERVTSKKRTEKSHCKIADNPHASEAVLAQVETRWLQRQVQTLQLGLDKVAQKVDRLASDFEIVCIDGEPSFSISNESDLKSSIQTPGYIAESTSPTVRPPPSFIVKKAITKMDHDIEALEATLQSLKLKQKHMKNMQQQSKRHSFGLSLKDLTITDNFNEEKNTRFSSMKPSATSTSTGWQDKIFPPSEETASFSLHVEWDNLLLAAKATSDEDLLMQATVSIGRPTKNTTTFTSKDLLSAYTKKDLELLPYGYSKKCFESSIKNHSSQPVSSTFSFTTRGTSSESSVSVSLSAPSPSTTPSKSLNLPKAAAIIPESKLKTKDTPSLQFALKSPKAEASINFSFESKQSETPNFEFSKSLSKVESKDSKILLSETKSTASSATGPFSFGSSGSIFGFDMAKSIPTTLHDNSTTNTNTFHKSSSSTASNLDKPQPSSTFSFDKNATALKSISSDTQPTTSSTFSFSNPVASSEKSLPASQPKSSTNTFSFDSFKPEFFEGTQSGSLESKDSRQALSSAKTANIKETVNSEAPGSLQNKSELNPVESLKVDGLLNNDATIANSVINETIKSVTASSSQSIFSVPAAGNLDESKKGQKLETKNASDSSSSSFQFGSFGTAPIKSGFSFGTAENGTANGLASSAAVQSGFSFPAASSSSETKSGFSFGVVKPSEPGPTAMPASTFTFGTFGRPSSANDAKVSLGNQPQPVSTSGTTSLATASPIPAFGQPSVGTAIAPSSAFGAPSMPNPFLAPPTFGSTSLAFGSNPTMTSSTFGSTQPSFGSLSAFGLQQPVFGQPASVPTFGQSTGLTFGTSSAPSTFGTQQTSSQPTFGSISQPFGSTQPATTFGSLAANTSVNQQGSATSSNLPKSASFSKFRD